MTRVKKKLKMINKSIEEIIWNYFIKILWVNWEMKTNKIIWRDQISQLEMMKNSSLFLQAFFLLITGIPYSILTLSMQLLTYKLI